MNYSPQTFSNALSLMGPEIALVIAIIFATLWNLLAPRQRSTTPLICLLFLTAAIVMLIQQFALPSRIQLFPPGLFVIDHLTVAFGLLSCLFGIMVVLMTMGYDYHFGDYRGEYYALLLSSVLAVMLLAGTTDLVMLFVSLETLTLAGVLLSGFAKRDRKGNEASLKYLLSTAAVTATFLYGISFLYGL